MLDLGSALGVATLSQGGGLKYGEIFYKTPNSVFNSQITIVNRIKAANFPGSPAVSQAGAKVSVRGPLLAAYIGHAAPAGDAYDFAATPVQLTFAGSPSLGGDGSLLVTSDSASAFTWNGTSDIIVAINLNGAYALNDSSSGVDAYYKLSVADAATMDKSGYSMLATHNYCVEAVRLPGFAVAATDRALNIVCDGNSLTVGFGLTPDAQPRLCYPSILRSLARYGSTVANLGVNSATTAQRQAANSTGPLFSPRSIAVLWECTNDLFFNQDAAGAISRYWSWCDAVRAQGFRVMAVDVLPRAGAGGVYAGFETDRQTVNAAIVAGWPSHADGLASVAGVAAIGAVGANNNTTYYQTDKTHLTALGYGLVAQTVSAAVLSLS